jgi:outer membrane DcaP-like protein
MTVARKVRRLAVITGLTTAAGITAVSIVASADELPNSSATEGSVQQRIEQLAQVGEGGTKSAPGTLVTGGSFPRSFIIPGTETSLRVGGEVRFSVDYQMSGSGNGINDIPTNTIGTTGLLEGTPLDIHGQSVPGLGVVPVDLAHSRSHYVMFSPRESRIRIETRTPTQWGEALTAIEFDALGGVASAADPAQVANSLILRMRHAYATLGPWLIGQTSNWLFDGESHSETLDFGGEPFLGPDRQPQIRFTQPVSYIPGAAVALEFDLPDTDVRTAAGKFDSDNTTRFPGVVAFPAGVGTINPAGGTINPAKAGAPDTIFGAQFDQPGSHTRLGLVLRDLKYNDGRFINKEYIGYGGGVQGWFNPGWLGWERDGIQYGFGAGEGIGRQITGSTNDALDTNYGAFAVTSLATAKNVNVKPITEFAGWLGYTHHWLPNLRSNISAGIRHEDYNSNLIGPAQTLVADKELVTAHVNLIWAPVPFADLGIEYLFGHRQVVANLKGDLNSILTRFRMRF